MLGLAIIIYVCCFAGLVWAWINAKAVTDIKVYSRNHGDSEEARHIDMMLNVGGKIEKGA